METLAIERFTINTDCENGILKAWVSFDEPVSDATYFFYLYQESNLVYKDEKYNSDNTRTWDLKEFYSQQIVETFYVRVFVRNKTGKFAKKSGAIYITVDKDNQLAEKLELIKENRDTSALPPKLSFYKRKYPFADFCLCYNMDPTSLYNLGHKENMRFHVFPNFNDGLLKDICMISTVPVTKNKKVDFVFGGTGRTDTEFVFGQNDAYKLDDPRLLTDSVGCFFLIYQDEEQIYIGTDYFGMTKLYYYKDDANDSFIVSNRYHLLLLAMSEYKIEMKVNTKKMMAYLYRNDMPYQQNFARDMEIVNTYIQPIDECFSITKSGVKILNKEIYDDLRVKEPFEEEKYEELVLKAKKEVVDNVRIIYKNDHFKRISFDATGGLDTREVIAAYSCLDDELKKEKESRIFSVEKVNQLDDVLIGYYVGKSAGLEYKAWPIEEQPIRQSESWTNAMSSLFGEWYIFEGASNKANTDNMLRLDGTCGDICGRAVYAKLMIHTDKRFNKIEDLIRWTDSKPLSTIKSNALKQAHEYYMTREIEKLPGRSLEEKYDIHYLFYRNGTHMGKFLAPELDNPNWGPCQSKDMFRLKIITFRSLPDLKIRFDLMYALNPSIASLPYEYEGNNEAMDDLVQAGQINKVPSMTIDEIRSEKEAIFQERKEYSLQNRQLKKCSLSEQEIEAIKDENSYYNERLMQWFRYGLADLLNAYDGEIEKLCGKELILWAQENILEKKTLSRMGRIFVNKVMYFYYLRQFAE
ncbi:MAG: hypothetical protein IKD89_07980 [Clostridia bacterium]|nr:hypothetical protein [Clostridia bacterium]